MSQKYLCASGVRSDCQKILSLNQQGPSFPDAKAGMLLEASSSSALRKPNLFMNLMLPLGISSEMIREHGMFFVLLRNRSDEYVESAFLYYCGMPWHAGDSCAQNKAISIKRTHYFYLDERTQNSDRYLEYLGLGS